VAAGWNFGGVALKIDNTMFSMYAKCPSLYFERYEADASLLCGVPESPLERRQTDLLALPEILNNNNGPRQGLGIELARESPSRDFGTRMHQLLHERRLDRMGFRPNGQLHSESQCPPGEFIRSPEWPSEDIEAEAQATLAAYEAHYIRDYEYIESERTSTVPLDRPCPECGGRGLAKLDIQTNQRVCRECHKIFTIHELVVKLDAVVRHGDETIGPMDTKTESKPGYNTREDWAGRTQAKIYLYALGALYPDQRVSRLVVDVVSRGSPKARRGPIFYRHDDIGSSPEGLEEAIRNVNYVADRIEAHRREGWWPANMNACKKGWERCDYFDLHVLGRSAENLRKYKPAEQYLDL
jgi:PD-(D/E)XK nuclease superfamily